jgi:two-component system NtrC family sensor kinase
MVFSLVGPTLMFLYVAVSTRQATIDVTQARLVRVAQVAQEHAQRVVETNDVIARAIGSVIGGRGNDQLRADAATLHTQLKALAAELPQLQSIWLWDQEGRPIASSLRADPPPGLSVADREYFVWARTTSEAGWFVSEPLTSRTTGQPFFDFVRRRQTDAGVFAGAMSVSLAPGYFSEFFEEQVQEEPGFAVVLARADGVLISRFPPAPAAFTRFTPPSVLLQRMTAREQRGDTTIVSTIDGRARFLSFRQVAQLPLYTAATADLDIALARWRRWTLLLALFTFPLALGLFALCAYARRSVLRQHLANQKLKREYDHRLRAEEALRQSQKMEALGRLTGGVAHDFNNLLMVIQSSVALANMLEQRQRPVGPALAPIERALANGAQLTRQLLAIARRQPLQVRSVSVAEVLQPLSALLASTLGSSIQVELDLADGLAPVEVDQAELELALINLCINAKDAMPQGGRITMKAEPASMASPSGGDEVPAVRISVIDKGVGIPPDMLHKVREPFFTTKPLGRGTGLGLSQVQSFVDACGGRLVLQSQPGQGTLVEILLPTSSKPVLRSTDPGDLPLSTLHGHVLLVEDNADIAQSLQGLLHGWGAEVSHYPTAEAALDGIRAGTVRPDLVLSDIALAGRMTGLDLAADLRTRLPELPVVLMTGYTNELDRAVAQDFRVLPKPVAPADLAAVLAEWISAKPS